MATIQVPDRIFIDDASFHAEFSRVMGFLPEYGRNWDAFIDCMTSIDRPEEQMSAVTVQANENLEIQVLVEQPNRYYETRTWALFAACVATVNGRFLGLGVPVRIVLAEKIATRLTKRLARDATSGDTGHA